MRHGNITEGNEKENMKNVEKRKDIPLFSVIVLTYLQGHLIEKCLDSILNQTYPNMELVICDDCSADFDEDRLRSYIEEKKEDNLKNLVIYKQSHNVGTTANAKTGIELSHGKYFKLHAGDDLLYHDDVLQNMADFFAGNEDAEIVCCRSVACTFFGDMTNDCYPSYEAYCKMEAADAQQQFTLIATQSWGEYINAPSVFWRRDLYDGVGGFDMNYCYTEDWPMWLKITALGHRIVPRNVITTIYRYGGISNGESMINQTLGAKHYRESIQMLEEYGLSSFQKAGNIDALKRCKHCIQALEARIVCETMWKDMSFFDKIAWKWENRVFLLNSWLYRKEKWGAAPFCNRNWLYALLTCLILYWLNCEILPGIPCKKGWAIIFLCVAAIFALRYIIAIVFRVYLKTRRRRALQNGR